MSLSESLPAPIFPSGVIGGGISSSSSDAIITSTDNFISQPKNSFFYDNLIELNSNETGSGITKTPALGGFFVNRGLLDDFYFTFDESDQTTKFGLTSNLKILPGVDPSTLDGILKWDSTNKCFSNTSPTDTFTIGDIVINGTTTINTQTLSWPSITPSSGYVLSNDGSNNLSWVSPMSGTASLEEIKNPSATTTIETNRTSFPNNIFVKANSVDIINATNTETRVLNKLNLVGGLCLNTTNATDLNYITQNNDIIINWSNANNGSITLPSASINSGRFFIIQNKSADKELSILTTGGDLLDGEAYINPLVNNYDHITLVSDGMNNWIII